MENTYILLLSLLVPLLTFAALALLDPDTRVTISGSYKTHSELSNTPTHSSSLSLVTVFVLVLSKYLGFSPKLKQNADGTFLLPELEVRTPLHVSSEDVERYYRALLSAKQQKDAKAKSSGRENPIFLLAALTTPLMLQLLCKSANPVLPLGAVNVKNRYDFLDPIACRLLRDFQQSHPLRIVAKMGGKDLLGRRMKRGMQFDMVIEVQTEDKPIFRQTFTALQFVKLKGPKPAEVAVESKGPRTFTGPDELLTIEANAPSRYAVASKDYNPIHTSSLAAKLFGFSRKIAHGNLTVAMVLDDANSSTVTSSGKSSMSSLWNEVQTPSFLITEFKRPIPVPAKMQIKWASDGAQVVSKKGEEKKVHVDFHAGLI